MEYTQEQIDEMMNTVKTEATKGLFTEDDLTRRVTSEVDRRVDTGIKKGVETQKIQWEKDLTTKANLTAEELATKTLGEQTKLIEGREKELSRRTNLLNAKDLLSDAKIPKKSYQDMLEMLVTNDEDGTTANVSKFIEMFNATKTDIETEYKSSMSKIKSPETGSKDTVTKESFAKMGYAQKIKFKAESPDLYKTFIK